MKTIRLLCALGFGGLCSLVAGAHDTSAPLNAEQKQFLADYEQVRAALAADNLAAAQKAAAPIADRDSKSSEKRTLTRGEKAAALTKASTLDAARDAFKALSKSAVHLAEGKEGYYVAHCPMVPNDEGDWVQTTKEINNPYMGKAMLSCGSIEK